METIDRFDLQIMRTLQREGRLSNAALAERVGAGEVLSAPRDLSALPLLGIPEVVRENAVRDFYLDTDQFRPLGARTPVAVISSPEAAALAL